LNKFCIRVSFTKFDVVSSISLVFRLQIFLLIDTMTYDLLTSKNLFLIYHGYQMYQILRSWSISLSTVNYLLFVCEKISRCSQYAHRCINFSLGTTYLHVISY
jgi:hypothetical protein